MVNPYEPSKEGEETIVVGLCDRSKGIRLAVEETALIEPGGAIHWPLAERLGDLESYSLPTPYDDKRAAETLGEGVAFTTRLTFARIPPKPERFTLKFAYRTRGGRDLKYAQVTLVRRTSKY